MTQVIEKDKLVNKEILTPEEKKKRDFLKGVNLVSKQTLSLLTRDKIPPTPLKYKIYFEKILDSRPHEQKEMIYEFMASEEDGSGFHNVGLEKKAQQSFLHIKSMAESVAISYQKLKKVLNLTHQKIEELSASPNRLALLSYEEDLQKIEKSLIVEMKSINAQYKKTAELIKAFNTESIYDKKFDVFNKKYLLKMLDNEIQGINKYSHDSVLLAIDIKKTNLDDHKFSRNRVLILQTLAKLLLKRSRRSDVLAHYSNGIFIIMLVHTDLEHSQKAINSIKEMISTASFIVDSESVEIELVFGVAKIEPNMLKEQVITAALEDLNKNR